MKKLLSILAAVGLTATAGAAVVACGSAQDDKGPETVEGDFKLTGKQQLHVYDTEKFTFEVKENMTDFEVKVQTPLDGDMIVEVSEITFTDDKTEGEFTLTALGKGKVSINVLAKEKAKDEEADEDGDKDEPKTFVSDKKEIVVEEFAITEILKKDDSDLKQIKDDGEPNKDDIANAVKSHLKEKLNEKAIISVSDIKNEEEKGTASVEISGYQGKAEVSYTYVDNGETPDERQSISSLGFTVKVGAENIEAQIQDKIDGVIEGTEIDVDYTVDGDTEAEGTITVKAIDDSKLIKGDFTISVIKGEDPEGDEVDASIDPEDLIIYKDETPAILTINTEGAIAHTEFGKETHVEISQIGETNTWQIIGKKVGTVSIIVQANGFKDKQFVLDIREPLAKSIEAELDKDKIEIGNIAILTVSNYTNLDDIKVSGESLNIEDNKDGTYTISSDKIVETKIIITANDKEGNAIAENWEHDFVVEGKTIEVPTETIELNYKQTETFIVKNIKDLTNFKVESNDETVVGVIGWDAETGLVHIYTHQKTGETTLLLTALNAKETQIKVEVKEADVTPEPVESMDKILYNVDRQLGEFEDQFKAKIEVARILNENGILEFVKFPVQTDTYIRVVTKDDTKLTGETTFFYTIKEVEPKPETKHILMNTTTIFVPSTGALDTSRDIENWGLLDNLKVSDFTIDEQAAPYVKAVKVINGVLHFGLVKTDADGNPIEFNQNHKGTITLSADNAESLTIDFFVTGKESTGPIDPETQDINEILSEVSKDLGVVSSKEEAHDIVDVLVNDFPQLKNKVIVDSKLNNQIMVYGKNSKEIIGQVIFTYKVSIDISLKGIDDNAKLDLNSIINRNAVNKTKEYLKNYVELYMKDDNYEIIDRSEYTIEGLDAIKPSKKPTHFVITVKGNGNLVKGQTSFIVFFGMPQN